MGKARLSRNLSDVRVGRCCIAAENRFPHSRCIKNKFPAS
ncbi:hypothetical protein BN2497_11249 [Janthinobacterium sp. CG23_2]|nr:hypothetical protein BN2497_11249 [Janthinobacterium sp. CG23_2]CUU32022.1 hypothetical protein BN3177_11249 [Janthinobacterium sp. CG23_2]